MSIPEELELRVEREGSTTRLRSPGVGWFTAAVPRGRVLTAGEDAGVLLVLGRAVRLRVPAGAFGIVLSERPERVREPVGYGQVLYELGALEGEVAAELGALDPASHGDVGLGLVLRAPHGGRFYHRPSPGDEPFAPPGKELAEGDPVGLIEVMKTFATVPYRATGGLPPRARVVRLLAEDPCDVSEGDPLLEVEPA